MKTLLNKNSNDEWETGWYLVVSHYLSLKRDILQEIVEKNNCEMTPELEKSLQKVNLQIELCKTEKSLIEVDDELKSRLDMAKLKDELKKILDK